MDFSLPLNSYVNRCLPQHCGNAHLGIKLFTSFSTSVMGRETSLPRISKEVMIGIKDFYIMVKLERVERLSPKFESLCNALELQNSHAFKKS